jgi:photosystem I subunit 2
MNTEYPFFEGNTGGWLKSAETEEKYVLTWTNLKNENFIFEMPTGGAASMREGKNLVYFARKEQALALARQLKNNWKITNYRIFRLFPTGEIQFLHPKDAVFPEKVNQGRRPVGYQDFSIGNNPNPINRKFRH